MILVVTGLEDLGVAALAEALITNRTITDLDLGNNLIGESAAEALAEVLRTNRTLTKT